MKWFYQNLFLVSALCLGVTPPHAVYAATATDAQNGSCGDGCTWSYDGAGHLSITGNGNSNITNKSWKDLSATWVTSVTVKGVEALPSKAFENYSNLANVNLSNDLTSIGEKVFSNCTGLKTIDIPNSVTSIGKQSFYKSGLEYIDIPNSVTTIGQQAFDSTKSLESVIIADSVTTMDTKVFNGSTVQEILLPADISSTKKETFNGMPSDVKIICQGAIENCQKYGNNKLANMSTIVAATEYQCNGTKYYWNGNTCVNQPDKSKRVCSSSYKYNDGYCDRVIYTPAEAARFLRNDATNVVTITFKK